MKYHYRSTQKMAGFLSIACTLLFGLYAILFYLNHQSGILALGYYVESELVSSNPGMTAIWISASLGTLLCIIPAMILLHWLHFPLRFKALAFLPSYILLGMITGIAPESVTSVENYIPLLPSVLLLVLSAVLIFFSQTCHEDRGEHAPLQNYLGINVLVSCIGMMLCIALTNTDRQLHVQLEMAEAIHRNDFSVMEGHPRGETISNNTITSMQVLHLSKQGLLADRLFSLPNLKGSESMLPDTFPASMVYHIPTLVYGHLQAVPAGKCGNALCFIEKALDRRTAVLAAPSATRADSLRARPLADYYLCALLLERKLHRFSEELPKHYALDSSLPRHYREAMAMYHSSDSSTALRPFHDSAMDSIYTSYRDLLQRESAVRTLQRKACFQAYPHSYWNYYFFGYNDKRE